MASLDEADVGGRGSRRSVNVFDLTTIDGAQYIDGRRSHPEAMLCATKVFFYPPKPIQVRIENPLLASLGPNWIVERKLGGNRALVLRGPGTDIKAWTRKARPISLPKIIRQAVLGALPEWTLGDCQYVPRSRRLYLLDLVALRGRFLADERLVDRKFEVMSLMSTVSPGGEFAMATWRPLDRLPGGLEAYYRATLKEGYEGIVLKDFSSKWVWHPLKSRETTYWLKVRPNV